MPGRYIVTDVKELNLISRTPGSDPPDAAIESVELLDLRLHTP
jgi:hypothetical protein